MKKWLKFITMSKTRVDLEKTLQMADARDSMTGILERMTELTMVPLDKLRVKSTAQTELGDDTWSGLLG